MNKDETIYRDPTTGAEKAEKLARFDLIPVGPLTALAEHFGKGARKYDDRNFERGYPWSKSFAAMMRHAWLFWGGEDYDAHDSNCPPDCDKHTESHHLTAVAWHAFALLEFVKTHPERDDRAPETEAQKADAEHKAHVKAHVEYNSALVEKFSLPPLQVQAVPRRCDCPSCISFYSRSSEDL